MNAQTPRMRLVGASKDLNLLALAAALLLLVPPSACVPHVDIEGAPCPCPSGYACCAPLAACLAADASCPDTYPESSDRSCARDSDCPRGELCLAWSTEATGGLAGPRTCRRDCSTGFACHGAEKCGLVLHDGASVDGAGAALAQACTVPSLAQGCDSPGCRDCNASYLGRTFCQEKTVHACFHNVHPVCGLICSNDVVQGCGDAGCMDDVSQLCNAEPSGDPCETFSCDACPDPADPDTFACDATARMVGCLVAEYAGGGCERICKPVSLDCPAATVCSDDGGYAHCAPER